MGERRAPRRMDTKTDGHHMYEDHVRRVLAEKALTEATRAARGEPVVVEAYADRTWCVFSTELGMYRIADKYGAAAASRGQSALMLAMGLGWYVRLVQVR